MKICHDDRDITLGMCPQILGYNCLVELDVVNCGGAKRYCYYWICEKTVTVNTNEIAKRYLNFHLDKKALDTKIKPI